MENGSYEEWLKHEIAYIKAINSLPSYQKRAKDADFYTYQDWIDGKFEPKDLKCLQESGRLSIIDYKRIRKNQLTAYYRYLNNRLDLLKQWFKRSYIATLLKDDFLNEEITRLEGFIKRVKEEDRSIYDNARKENDGRNELTANHINTFMQDGKRNYEDWREYDLIKDSKNITPVLYVINTNYLKWLYWFKEQIILDKSEPGINTNPITRETNRRKHSEEVFVGSSYFWQGLPEGIEILYSELIKGGYIPDSTEIDNFKALFSGKSLNEIKPILWLKKKNLLAYLIDQLYDISMFPDGTNHWSIAETCFVGIKNLRQQRANYLNNNQGKPTGFRRIDNIITILKQFTDALQVNDK